MCVGKPIITSEIFSEVFSWVEKPNKYKYLLIREKIFHPQYHRGERERFFKFLIISYVHKNPYKRVTIQSKTSLWFQTKSNVFVKQRQGKRISGLSSKF